MDLEMKKMDLASYSFGGLVFGICAVVTTVIALKESTIPDHLIDTLKLVLAFLALLSLFYILYRQRISKRLFGVEIKGIEDIANEVSDSIKDLSFKDLKQATMANTATKIKEIAALYVSIQGRILITKSLIAVAGTIAIFYSAAILVAQVKEMRKQSTQFGKQLEELKKQNKQLEHQIKAQSETSRTSRITELVQLLYDNNNNIAIKSMALKELSGLDSEYLVLENAQLSEYKIPKLNLSQRPMRGIDFRKAELIQANLSKSEIMSAQLNNLKTEHSNFYKANLSLSDMSNSILSMSFWFASKMRGVNLDSSQMGHNSFSFSDLSSSISSPKNEDLMGCHIKGYSQLSTSFSIISGGKTREFIDHITRVTNSTSFHDRFNFSTINDTDFSNTEFTGSRFKGAHGKRTIFTGSSLQGVHFQKSNLPRAKFDAINYIDAYFSESTLTGTDWSKSNIHFVDFSGADLRCANFTDTKTQKNSTKPGKYHIILSGANLKGAKGLTPNLLDKSCGDAKTKLPANLSDYNLANCPDTVNSLRLHNVMNEGLYITSKIDDATYLEVVKYLKKKHKPQGAL